jgi:hypothetical protein
MNPGQGFGSGQRLLERQVLIAVQGVVMDEIQDRRLPGQNVIQMSDGLLDPIWRGPSGRADAGWATDRGHGALLRQFG